MPIDSNYDKLVTLSPYIELGVRRLYYRYEDKLKKFNKRSSKKTDTQVPITADFEGIIDAIKAELTSANDIVIVHSTLASLKHIQLDADEMLSRLLNGLGRDVTLAMPAIPMYPNEVGKKALSEAELCATNYLYNVSSTRIWTGSLPQAMIKHPDSYRSHHPLNSMVAIGPMAESMMHNNLASPTACGEHSSWNFCRQRNALIVGLGSDLTHSLTMVHLAEDTWPDDWPIKDWYIDRSFRIKDGESTIQVHVKERKHVWGKLHLAERTLAKDLIRSKTLTSRTIDNVTVEHIRAASLIEFLQLKNVRGYPYFWLPKHSRR